MGRAWTVALIVLAGAVPARGQLRGCVDLDRLNRRLGGCVVDYTHNHGADRRVFSPILGRPRDLYVYLPPGYSPSRSYPLVVYLHMGYVDEHTFVGSDRVDELDGLIRSGLFPPAVVAIPDGLIDGENRLNAPHSLFLNGIHGRFEDHLLYEVIPFVESRYAIRRGRESHALLGASAGGLGAASLALRHPDRFGAVATIGAPLNLRYSTCRGDVREDFDPSTYRWKTAYDPGEIVGSFYLGLRRVPAEKYIAPVFGDDPAEVFARVVAINPADLLFTADPKPGRPAMYVHYGGRDNWNFDAQAESFLWLASLKGFPVDSEVDPRGRHNLPYFRRGHIPAFLWLGAHLMPPTEPIDRVGNDRWQMANDVIFILCHLPSVICYLPFRPLLPLRPCRPPRLRGRGRPPRSTAGAAGRPRWRGPSRSPR